MTLEQTVPECTRVFALAELLLQRCHSQDANSIPVGPCLFGEFLHSDYRQQMDQVIFQYLLAQQQLQHFLGRWCSDTSENVGGEGGDMEVENEKGGGSLHELRYSPDGSEVDLLHPICKWGLKLSNSRVDQDSCQMKISSSPSSHSIDSCSFSCLRWETLTVTFPRQVRQHSTVCAILERTDKIICCTGLCDGEDFLMQSSWLR